MVSTFTTPLRLLRQALRATTAIKPDPDEVMHGLAQVIIDGSEMVVLTRHIAVRFAFPTSETTFEGDPFVITAALRKAILGVPFSQVRSNTVTVTATDGIVTATAGDVLDVTEFGFDGMLPPYPRMFKEYPLVDGVGPVRVVAHTQTPVAPDWRVGFNPQLFAFLAPYSKAERGAPISLTFFADQRPVHFTFNDGLDGLIMPTRIAR